MTSNLMSNQDDAIAASAALTRAARADFASRIDRLDGELADVGRHWQGAGAAAFARVAAAWHDRVTSLLSALDGFAEDLGGVDQTFQTTNDDTARTFDLLASRLG
jgi:WXG100 family type VII secretion target